VIVSGAVVVDGVLYLNVKRLVPELETAKITPSARYAMSPTVLPDPIAPTSVAVPVKRLIVYSEDAPAPVGVSDAYATEDEMLINWQTVPP